MRKVYENNLLLTSLIFEEYPGIIVQV